MAPNSNQLRIDLFLFVIRTLTRWREALCHEENVVIVAQQVSFKVFLSH